MDNRQRKAVTCERGQTIATSRVVTLPFYISTTEQVLMSTDQNQGLGKLRQLECEGQSTDEEEAKQNKTEICIEVPLSVGLNIKLHM